MPTLTSVPQVKKYLRLSTDEKTDDGLLQVLADAAQDSILSAISRNILTAQYTETRNGTGTSTLVLSNTPVTAVGSVQLAGPLAFASAPLNTVPLAYGVDYTFSPSAIKLYSGVFPRGVANIVVEYTAGVPDYPSDLVHVASKWAAIRYREMERLGQASKTLQGETVLFDLTEMSADMQGVVNRHSSKIPVIGAATGLV